MKFDVVTVAHLLYLAGSALLMLGTLLSLVHHQMK
jgi:hypothetical protein